MFTATQSPTNVRPVESGSTVRPTNLHMSRPFTRESREEVNMKGRRIKSKKSHVCEWHVAKPHGHVNKGMCAEYELTKPPRASDHNATCQEKVEFTVINNVLTDF
jgi:hypothetical protein